MRRMAYRTLEERREAVRRLVALAHAASVNLDQLSDEEIQLVLNAACELGTGDFRFEYSRARLQLAGR
jgi:hypothetical protein